MKKRSEGREVERAKERERESEQFVGMQAGEECGFHGNSRKAELWVSVPALHCTGPRLSLTPRSLQLPPLYLSPTPSSLPVPTSPPLPPIPRTSSAPSPPSVMRGEGVTHTLRALYVIYISSSARAVESTCAVSVSLHRRFIIISEQRFRAAVLTGFLSLPFTPSKPPDPHPPHPHPSH